MAKKGSKFNKYSEEIKQEAVRLHLEEGMSFRAVTQLLGLQSKTQVLNWVKRFKDGKAFGDDRLRPPLKPDQFNSIEEELEFYKLENAYLKKRNPNLHGEGSWTKRNDSK